jgi:acyl dehydratase
MSVSPLHVFRNGPVVAALVKTAVAAATGSRKKKSGRPEVPGPAFSETVPPRHPDLIRDYIRHVGGDPSWYKGQVPPHLFPQWGFPIMGNIIGSLPYDLTRIMNAGCVMQMKSPIQANRALRLEAQLMEVDDNGERAIVRQQLTTGTRDVPAALVCQVMAYVPLKRSKQKGKAKREKPRVPVDVREIARWRLRPDAGLEFAKLTGDFNPIHWIRPVARMSGFRSTILHGYSTLARAVESLNRELFKGRPWRLKELEVRFARPLVIPSRVGVYIDAEGGLFVGDAPGGPAYLTGTFKTREENGS